LQPSIILMADKTTFSTQNDPDKETKIALFVHVVLFSASLLQTDFELGILWFLMNFFVLIFLARSRYTDKPADRLICWYLYVTSIFTDILCISVWGHTILHEWVLAIACILLISKVAVVYLLYRVMKKKRN